MTVVGLMLSLIVFGVLAIVGTVLAAALFMSVGFAAALFMIVPHMIKDVFKDMHTLDK